MNNTLNKSAVLADLTIHSAVTARTDLKVTASVEKDHKTLNAGRWVKNLYDKRFFKEILAVDYEIRELFSQSSLPYRKGSENIITSQLLPIFLEKFRLLVAKRDKLADALAKRFSELVDDARSRLNGTFKPADYPVTAEAFRNQFSVSLDISPIPRLDDLEDPILRANAERALATRVNGAHEALVTRLAESLARLGDTLKDHEKVFRDSTITQARRALADADALNVGGNPEITKAVASARDGLEKYLAEGKEDELRDQPAVRELVAVTATKAVSQFEQLANAFRSANQ
jgi:hypothetical protein